MDAIVVAVANGFEVETELIILVVAVLGTVGELDTV